MNLGERQKISPERPRLFQGKEGDRMRDGVPAEWNGHPWGQLCKTEFTIKLDVKLLQRSQETQLKVNGERTLAPWKDLKLFGHS